MNNFYFNTAGITPSLIVLLSVFLDGVLGGAVSGRERVKVSSRRVALSDAIHLPELTLHSGVTGLPYKALWPFQTECIV